MKEQINKLIEILATWFYKQIKKESYLTILLMPIIMIIGIFVCIWEEIDEKNSDNT